MEAAYLPRKSSTMFSPWFLQGSPLRCSHGFRKPLLTCVVFQRWMFWLKSNKLRDDSILIHDLTFANQKNAWNMWGKGFVLDVLICFNHVSFLPKLRLKRQRRGHHGQHFELSYTEAVTSSWSAETAAWEGSRNGGNQSLGTKWDDFHTKMQQNIWFIMVYPRTVYPCWYAMFGDLNRT